MSCLLERCPPYEVSVRECPHYEVSVREVSTI